MPRNLKLKYFTDKMDKDDLVKLMHAMKTNGNIFFKNGCYREAWLHYSRAFDIVMNLKEDYNEITDRTFVSHLFSNRAMCCLKQEMYYEALQDCDWAIGIDGDNVKAYFRKVLSLKELRQYEKALKIANIGMEKQPSAFVKVIAELQELMSSSSNSGQSRYQSEEIEGASVRDVTEPDAEWLEGTNVNVTEESLKKTKMPGRKKNRKRSPRDRTPKTVEIKPKQSSTMDEAESLERRSSDEESDESNLEVDANFVSLISDIQQGKVDKLTYKSRKGQNTLTQQAEKPRLKTPDRLSPQQSNGITKQDHPPCTKSTSKKPTGNKCKLSDQQRALLKFPLSSEYEYILACDKCFVKMREGINGCRYIPNQTHPCDRGLLLVSELNKAGRRWVKVRQRPLIRAANFRRFMLCQQFSVGQACTLGEQRCTFAHNQAEIDMWTMDIEGLFDIESFIKTAQQLQLYDSNLLQKALGTDYVSKVNIPGLQYKTDASSDKQTLNLELPYLLASPPEVNYNSTVFNSISSHSLTFEQPLDNFNIEPAPAPQNRSLTYGANGHVTLGGPTLGSFMPGMGPVEQSQPDENEDDQLMKEPILPVFPTFIPQAPPRLRETSELPKLTNPLKDRYIFKIMCKHCLVSTGYPGKYEHKDQNHTCEENVLGMNCRLNHHWIRIRERTNHRDFPGNYKMCDSITMNDQRLCKYREDRCSFAHNEAEKYLWKLEKEGKWNVTEFIMQHRTLNTYKGYTAAEILAKHPGRFKFICRVCFFKSHLICYQVGNACNGRELHVWNPSKILAHFSTSGAVAPVNKRGFTHKTAFYKICNHLHFCTKQITGDCRFAHSFVERDMWMLERDSGLSQEQIAQQLLELGQNGPPILQTDENAQGFDPEEDDSVEDSEQTPIACPYIISQVCRLCLKNGAISTQDGNKDQCNNRNKAHSLWSKNYIYISMRSKKQIRSLPTKIPSNLNFIMCEHSKKKEGCNYFLGDRCQFAHSAEEIEIWRWMVSNNVKNLEGLLRLSQQTQNKENSTDQKTGLVDRQRLAQLSMPAERPMSAFYCWYCGVQCNGQKQWEKHCSSQKHSFNLNSDKEHPWNYRQPPWEIPADKYQLCPNEQCKYSAAPDLFNLCPFAHSEEELEEWRERNEWRQMKRAMAKQQNVYSYMDQLLESYNSAESGSSVMVDSLDDVTIRTEELETLYLEEKGSPYTWRYEIITPENVQLEKVALLHNKDRLHFHLGRSRTDQDRQFAYGETFAHLTEDRYCVEVLFKAEMFGSFSQCVVFDFGLDVVVARKLHVEIGSRDSHEKVKFLRCQLNFDRWTENNRTIIPCPKPVDELQKSLLARYKPHSADTVVNRDSILQELNRHNYSHKMSKLLELEEITRHKIVSSFNMLVSIELTNKIMEGELLCAQPGELFARVPLNESLNEDTDAGKLILTSVRYVLLSPQNNSQKNVFEVEIFHSESNWQIGYGRDYIYLSLHHDICSSLKLSDGNQLDVEIQFQLNRLPFCEMQYAVDQLELNMNTGTNIVFPDIQNVRNDHLVRLSVEKLNEDQMTAVNQIFSKRKGCSPPIVIYGPFGTGKTETLAQVTMLLLQRIPGVRMLICTETNSAADLYITKHLDPFLKKFGYSSEKMVRIYYSGRRVNTVEEVVKRYCCLSPLKTNFVMPTKEDIEKCQICVVTLGTSLHLVDRKMKGMFTHIFVDEAAQALECDTIKPLCLANPNTCVVLAGDHLQLGPKVYSAEARDQKFGVSLLERLCYFYQCHSVGLNPRNTPNILFKSNYRSKEDILQFIALVFYGGQYNLVSRSNILPVAGIAPLTFYTVQGLEVQDSDSTSFYNLAEVEEVVDRVAELLSKWPAEWGEKNASEICVLAPYSDQVRFIRNGLRKKSADLRRVSVHNVENVPGREFQAVLLSTVRTRHLADTLQNSANGNYGFLSNPKLLNTALTRAQSLVAVVGDPVALCAIGECRTIWKTFLKHCQKFNSIYPRNVTFQNIRQHVQNVLNSASGQNIVKHAAQLQSSTSFPQMITAKDSAFASQTEPQECEGVWNTRLSPESSPVKLENSKTQELTRENFLDDWNEDFMLEPDDIIRQLAKIDVSDFPSSRQAGAQTSESAVNNTEPLKGEFILFEEHHGQIVVSYSPWEDAVKTTKRKLLTAEDAGRDYDQDTDYLDDVEKLEAYGEYSEEQLLQLLESQTERFKHCILHSDSRRMYAEIISPTSAVKEIEVSCRKRCGKALHFDEVVVEIIHCEDVVQEQQGEAHKVPVHGRVVGILKRHLDPRYRLFVCTVDPVNHGLMIPLNRGIPRIANLASKQHLTKASKNQVPVYKFTTDKEIQFQRYEKVDRQNVQNQLFVVRFLKWDAKFPFPLGIIVGDIPPGTSVEKGLEILNIEYNIPKKFSEETESLVNQLQFKSSKIPKDAFHNRMDYRKELVFTIDPPFSKDLDDALSLDELADGNYRVGIHIAEVAYYIKRDSVIDKEAARRGMSFYPKENSTVHMLHPYFSTNICSLLPKTDCLTVSIFITVSSDGSILGVQPQRCVIKPQRFSYDEIEDILQDEATSKVKLRKSLLNLGKLAQIWRYKRLGNAHLTKELDIDAKDSPNAHLLVEEMMIMTNHQVGKLLMANYPECTPLRNQQAPHPELLEEWKQAHAADAASALALTQPFLENYATCTCKRACTCVFNFMKTRKIKGFQEVSVLNSVWEDMVDAAHAGNYRRVQDLIVQAENHPNQTVALLNLYKIQQRSEYICSGSILGEADPGHYSLNLTEYVQFTSPIRRYLDLVAQRMVCALIDRKPCPYSQPEIQDLCRKITDATQNASRYHKACVVLHMATALKDKPVVVYPLVEEVSEADVVFQISSVPQIPVAQRQVRLALLAPCEKPTLSADESKISLKWKERVYELPCEHADKIEVPKTEGMTVKLNHDKFISKIPVFNWQKLLSAARQPINGKLDDGMQLSPVGNLPSVFENVRNKIKGTEIDGMFGHEITSEVSKGQKIIQHLCSFTTDICRSTVLSAQVSSSLNRGLLCPSVQLINLTPRLHLCLEHRRSPVACLAVVTMKPASKPRYHDEFAYKKAWLPVLSMESAASSVDSQDSLYIHNVSIKWHETNDGKAQGSNSAKVWGEFKLPVNFYRERQIKISNSSHDYLCLRYPKLELPEDPNLTKDIATIVNNKEPVTWTCHCSIAEIGEVDKPEATSLVKINLHQSTVPVPAMMYWHKPPLCTVEWIPRFLPTRRMEEAVEFIDKDCGIAADIAVGRTPSFTVDTSDTTYLMALTVPALPAPNPEQMRAITEALTQPFSLIQGPPGTGKTLIGVRLAYLFAQRNKPYKDNGTVRQVLYCGPSNKSVDVVAKYLKRLGSFSVKIVRVYSENIERTEFPLPREPVLTKRRSAGASVCTDPSLIDVAVHHVIRKPHKPFAHLIIAYDELFATNPDEVTDLQVEDYQRLITEAEVYEIAQADIVLTTCSASSSPRMKMGTKVKQVIIDECGMSIEPESMIPIVHSSPGQVVLIGDHKQLRPIVSCQQSRELGLETSLFERYSHKAIMLTTQYRMHQGIAKFPSEQFYDGKLTCGSPTQRGYSELDIWPNGRGSPIAFCHVNGTEETLTVSTEEGGEQSKSNQQEARVASSIASALVQNYGVKEVNIIILSQYRAQCATINQHLPGKGLNNVGVNTVISSQGSEWDYVILSTVRSLPFDQIERRPTEGWKRRNLGFITDDHQINVAITRAKKGLFIVGNSDLLECDSMWMNLIAHYRQEKKLIQEKDLTRLLFGQGT